MGKSKHCTPEQAQQVLDFAVAFGQMIGLPHHWIKISSEPAPDDAHGMIEHSQQRYLATIYLDRDWSKLSEFERFHTVVHEVCHMLHRRVETSVRTADGLMHDYEFDRLIEGFVTEIELMTDGLALAFCRMAEVRSLWYGPDAEATTDPEAGIVPAASDVS